MTTYLGSQSSKDHRSNKVNILVKAYAFLKKLPTLIFFSRRLKQPEKSDSKHIKEINYDKLKCEVGEGINHSHKITINIHETGAKNTLPSPANNTKLLRRCLWRQSGLITPFGRLPPVGPPPKD